MFNTGVEKRIDFFFGIDFAQLFMENIFDFFKEHYNFLSIQTGQE